MILAMASLSKKKESLNRKLQDNRYKSWLKRLENNTASVRQRYDDEHPRRSPQKRKDDLQHYAKIESECLKAIRELIRTPLKSNYTLLGNVVEFNKIQLYSIGLIKQAMTLPDEIERLKEICEDINEYEYSVCRRRINDILNQNAIPLFKDLYGNEIDIIDELSELAEEIDIYLHDFYKQYYHYKTTFEEAHERKRLLLSQAAIEESIVKDTLFLHILVHGEIPYEGSSIVTTLSPVNVYNLLHSSPGCVFYSSGQERRLYNKMHLFIDKYASVDQVIRSALPVMSSLNEKVRRNTLSKIHTTRRDQYAKNYLEHSKLEIERFYTAQGEQIVNKIFSFDLKVRPLHISKNFNLEGIKLVGAKHIEDAVDLVDYLPLKINDENQIVFTMRDIFDILPPVENIVIVDGSCQSSVHPVNKTSRNYRAITKKSQYRK
jgi:hypothetical protein